MSLLKTSHSPFQVVDNIEKELREKGSIELKENTKWDLEKNKSCYVKRNDSSIIAFRIPEILSHHAFHISAAHTDSPSFKIKPNPIVVRNNLMMLQTEPYGGGIYHTWMDRPLSFAGRLLVKDEKEIRTVLLDIDEDLLDIPSLCIHFDRNVNSGKDFNPAIDMIPVFGTTEKDFDFSKYLKEKAGLKDNEEILSYDLFLYVREEPRLIGSRHEFLLSPREDDLSSTYSSLSGFLEAESSDSISVYCAFDNEEVGSLTKQGAFSTFLSDVLHRIAKACGFDYEESVASSFLLSIDNAHANHPNHPEVSGAGVDCEMNRGIVLKSNANQSYTTDAFSSAIVKEVAEEAKVPLQYFTNRADLKGGSTLGNLSNNQVSLNAADIGIAQLAMHSCNELLGAYDIENMAELVKSYFSSDFQIQGNSIKL